MNPYAYVLVTYLLMSLALTYPLITHIRTHTVGMGDNWQFQWLFWWFDYSMRELGENPYYTYHQYYPMGTSLVKFESMPVMSAIAVMIQTFASSVLAYNLIFLATFVFSAFGTYMLAEYLTGDRIASLFAGLLFAFAPQRIGFSFGFLNLMNVHFLPFYILFLLKFLKERRYRYAILSSLFFSLNALSSWYLAILSIVVTVLCAAWFHKDLVKFSSRDGLKRMAVFALISFIFVFPFVFPLIQLAAEGNLASTMESSDIAAYLIPSTTNPFLKQYASPLKKLIPEPPSDMTLYIGFSVLLLVLHSIVRCNSSMVNFWKMVLIFFFVWSLGTNIKLFGKFTGIIPPLGFMTKLPVTGLITRLPAVAILIFMSSAILSAYAISDIARRLAGTRAYLFYIVLLVVILVEFMPVPMYITKPYVPEFYNTISQDNDDYAILELPFGECPGKTCPSGEIAPFAYTFYLYYQTYHEKYIFGGYLARNQPEENIMFTETTPVLYELKHSDIAESLPDRETTLFILDNLNVRYIVLHKSFIWDIPSGSLKREKIVINNTYVARTSGLLNDTLGDDLFYSDDMIMVYKVPEN